MLGPGVCPRFGGLLLVASLFCALVVDAKKSFDTLVDEADKAYQAQDYRLAAKTYHKAVKLRPREIRPVQFLGDALFKLGEHEKARRALARAHKLDPTHRTTRKMLADALAATGKLEDSLWHFGQVAVSSQITLPPLSEVLIEPWTTHPKKHPMRELNSDNADDARVFVMLPRGVPQEALRTLRDFLSSEVVGESYNFDFRSSSMRLKPIGTEPGSLLEQSIEMMREGLPPAAREAAKCAEWWVHRRPPKKIPQGAKRLALEGHPFHWDNDGDEAKGENPIFTSILYLTEAVGPVSPTVVLNTSKTDVGFYVGDAAWVVPAAEGRVAYVQGGMLHGVLPSAGAIELDEDDTGRATVPARLSLNVAWWPWECRVPEKVASVEGVPPADEFWAESLRLGMPIILRAPHPVFDAFCGDDLCGRGGGQQEL